jgi:hypothetical protein
MKSNFGWAVTLATFYGFGMVMTAFVVPQALIRLQNFRCIAGYRPTSSNSSTRRSDSVFDFFVAFHRSLQLQASYHIR